MSLLQTALKEGVDQHHVGVRGGRRAGLYTTDSPEPSPNPAAAAASPASAPRGSLIKQKSLGATGSASPLSLRVRSSSFHSVSTSTPAAEGLKAGKGKGKSPLLKQETVTEFGGNYRKSLFTKEDSILLDVGAAKPYEPTGMEMGGALEAGEWRGLNLEVLRKRIQRLVILMNLSEPGTIPNASILASLVDLVS